MTITRRSFLETTAAVGAASTLPFRSGDASERRRRPQRSRLVVDGLDTSVVNDEFLDVVRQGGAHCVHKTLYGTESFEAFHEFVDARRDRVAIATSVADIRAAHQSDKISFVLGVQSAGGYYGNGLDDAMSGVPLGSLELLAPALEGYRNLGLRIQGLCYNTYNVFGSGCLNHSVPLTRAGRHLVETIHEQRILLDIGGHTGERTSLDAIDVSSGVTVVCSHTNFAALNPNMRCISDRLAEAIAATGGVIGMTAISDFLVRNPEAARRDGATSPRATLDVLLDQYDYGKRLVGVDHLGLGPDFLWGQTPVSVNPENAVTFPPHSLSEGPVRTVKGFEDISQLPNLIAGLESRGWTDAELDKVLGDNWLRVYEEVW